ncbi:hypothetical protein J7L05_07270 [bacterium]|nr:hypothetical protein [bacterium]
MRTLVCLSIVLFALAFTGCSGGGDNALIPNPAGNINAGDLDSLPVIAFDGESAIGFLGAYNLAISPDGANAELISMRHTADGESYIVSGENFFTISPCQDCLRIDSIALDENGDIVLGMQVKHPFPKGNTSQPPSAINRLDLDVFDLALILYPIERTADTYSLTGIDAYPGILVNADGFTCELAEVIDDDAALPYKICYEDAKNNRFEMGLDYQDFNVVLSTGSKLVFDVYLTMGYGASAKKPQRLEPTYYVPEFNRKAAWKVDVTPPEGDDPPEIGNTWDTNDLLTEYTVTIDIYDWNHGATISPDFPDPDNTDQISASSDIGEVTVEIPGMTSAAVLGVTTDTTSNGWDDPLTYTAAIANENGLGGGEYTGLVKVTDSRIPGMVLFGGESDTLVHTPDGILIEWKNMPEYATYQTFTATVIHLCGPITGEILSGCPSEGIVHGDTLDFTVAATSDNGGNVVLYEVDFDYDGFDFIPDPNFPNNTDGIFDDVGPFNVPDPCESNIPYDFTVAFRATDDCVPPNETIFDECVVTVDVCEQTALIYSVTYVEKPSEDTWVDICVMPDGPVYIAADHPATGNVGSMRTAIRFDNDLTNMTVLNEGWGINEDRPNVFDKLDVSDGGYILNNPNRDTQALWSDPGGSSFTLIHVYGITFCGGHYFEDVWDVNEVADNHLCNYWKAIGCMQANCTYVWHDSNPTDPNLGGMAYGPTLYDYFEVVGIDGPGTAIFFISTDAKGYLSKSGDWVPSHSSPIEIATTGTLGTADGEFTGGLDVTCDSDNNIVTLEDHGSGVYRFQKFDYDLTWIYTSEWIDDGDPMRMDFDTADDYMVLISTTGVHIMFVT